jgi:1-acyl-sn-glycerol-3-phosphate acyltransferase
MIAANKNDFWDVVIFAWLKRRLRRQFYTISVRGLSHLQKLSPDRPTLAFSNHTNWWDGLIVFYLTRQAKHKSFYLMMDEKQLRHFRFFTWIGAFSVDLSNQLKAAAATRYAVRLLQKSENLMWIFPQGRMGSAYEPISIQPGTNFLALRSAGAQMLPAAFRYEFFRENRPHILVEIGEPFVAAESSDQKIEQSCQAAATRLEEAARSGNFEGFEQVLSPAWSINKKWEWVRLACCGKLKDFDPEN